ncbi:MAG: substrate-binding domain-containing protein [Rhodoferax sp.]|nr:substrate-binding domain-containing protein [Rhodoferax sp.]
MRLFKWMVLLTGLLLGIGAAAQSKDARVVAFAQDTMKNDFRQAQVFEVRDEVAKVPGLTFIYSDAQGQTSLLIRQIEQFIEQKVDVLVLGTSDQRAVVPVVSKAYKAGISVIVLDRGIQGNDFTTFINSDNVRIGAMGAEFLGNKLGGKGLVLLLEGLQTADVTHLRTKGFMDEIAKYPAIKVIKRTGNYLRKDALIEMEKLLAQGVRVDAIFSESDSMLSGVRMAMVAQKIDPKSVLSVGCDYTSEAREAIRNANQTASILFPLGGKMTVEVTQKLLRKESVPRHVVIPVKLVTRDNVEQVAPIF